MGKFAQAIGVHRLTVDKLNLDLQFEVEDVLRYTRILDEIKENPDNTSKAFELQINWLTDIIQRNDPSEKYDEIKRFVTLNFKVILEDFLVALKITDKKALEKKD